MARTTEKNEHALVYVWDLPTRALHWINATLIITLVALALGFEAFESSPYKETLEKVHAYAGHILVVTIGLRVLWGFIGNRYARWSDIIPLRAESWKAAGENLRWVLGGLKGKPPVAVGHNPLASLFYVALFVVLLGQAGSGLVLSGHEFGMFPGNMIVQKEGSAQADGGPYAAYYAYESEDRDGDTDSDGEGYERSSGGHGHDTPLVEAAEEFHEFGLVFMLIFIGAHLVGLVLHEIGEGRGLLRSMFTGKKLFHKDELRDIIEK